jgi:hypothetical protein
VLQHVTVVAGPVEQRLQLKDLPPRIPSSSNQPFAKTATATNAVLISTDSWCVHARMHAHEHNLGRWVSAR